jgi:hypothetical protein
MSRTEIHIERLIVDGLPFAETEVRVLRTALEAELADAFGAGIGAAKPTGDGVAGTERRDRVAPGSPAALGRQAARAIHRSVTR